MNLNSITAGPHVTGFIRIASEQDAGTGRVIFSNEIEVLARHHSKSETHPGGEPKLDKHPASRALMCLDANKAAGKLQEVPVRMFFSSAEKSLRIKYQAYNDAGRPMCSGDGCNARRASDTEQGEEVFSDHPCIGNEHCNYANSGTVTCRRQVAMTVQIEGHDDPLSVFEVRTTSLNSYKSLHGQLAYLHKRFKGLRHIPLKLTLWQSSNQASSFEAFDLFKLSLATKTEIEAFKAAKAARDEETSMGIECDFDEAFASGAHTMADEFAEISDFYRPVTADSHPTARSGSIAKKIANERNNGQTTFASDLLASTVTAAMAGQPQPDQTANLS